MSSFHLVMPTATQAQIKTAYYKQSFVYHPDRNAGSEEATIRFSEISEAYTVLGNKALRKKYDRGLLSQSDLVATARPSAKDSAGSPAKQQTESRRSVVGADIREGVFDFDKFFKSHYNEQLQKQRDIRVRKEEMLREKQEAMAEKKLGKLTEICVGVLLAMMNLSIINPKQHITLRSDLGQCALHTVSSDDDSVPLISAPALKELSGESTLHHTWRRHHHTGTDVIEMIHALETTQLQFFSSF
uniref:DnaJ heat shock protein family (Hsp40) member C30 n=1 Tax=Seriola dumerili TaxID=41447 RepID=A0A3B4V4D2_SERDU